MALFLPLFVNYGRIIAKKSGLWRSWQSHFGVLVLNHSSNNTVFCLHGFSESQKTAQVEECLYLKDTILKRLVTRKREFKDKRQTNNVGFTAFVIFFFYFFFWLCEIRMWKLVSRTILGLSIQNRNNSFFSVFFSFFSLRFFF